MDIADGPARGSGAAVPARGPPAAGRSGPVRANGAARPRFTIFFMSVVWNTDGLGVKGGRTCSACGERITRSHFNPMREWDIDGVLCGKCYSKKIDDYYPGDHVRINAQDG